MALEELDEVQRKWAKTYAKHQLTIAYIEQLEQAESRYRQLLLEYYRIVHAYGGPLGQHMPDGEYLEIRQRIDTLQAEVRKLLFP